MRQDKIYIYSDHIQKRIDELTNQINRNSLLLYQEYKPALDEVYLESVIEYEMLLLEFHVKEQELNNPLNSELEHLYNTCTPVKILDYSDVYFHGVVQ